MSTESQQYYRYARKQWIHAYDQLALTNERLEKDILENGEGTLQLPKADNYHNITHCMRVAVLSVQIGRLNNLSPQQLQELFIAGTFHDAGHCQKSGVPDKLNIDRAVEINYLLSPSR